MNRKILYRALRKAGVVNVANASNSHEFMQFVRDSSRPYDAVLMDEHMKGGLDGSKATEELRKYEKSRGLDEAVVVSISGSIQLGTSQEFLRLFSENFDACGSKPLEIRTIAEDLLACVNFCHGHPPPADRLGWQRREGEKNEAKKQSRSKQKNKETK
ncbi:MAG: response regulator, partial [Deltaproteobacteria bacterium]|nr:response regulator [Deltaproteobacteria bacterium]